MTATTQRPVQPNSSAHRTADPTLDSAQSTALVPRSVDSSHDLAAVAVVDAPPRAPTPPPAVNVFDFLIADGGGATDDEWESDGDNDMHVERYTTTTAEAYASNGFVYGSHPIPATFERYASHSNLNTPTNPHANARTPGPHGRTVSLDSTTAKKSGKRKRGPTLDTSAAQAHSRDVVMTDVPPATGSMQHSSLTGGLHRLMSRPDLPPSPDLSGGADSPSSPIKRSRHDGERRSTRTTRRATDEATRRSKEKSGKHVETSRRHGHRDDARRERRDGHHHRSARKRSASPKPSPPHRRAKQPRHHAAAAAPEPPSSPEPSPSNALVRVPPAGALTTTTGGQSTALVSLTVEHAPTSKGVDRFLDCLVKGSEREEGVSLWRALKRWRRDGGSGEKELWKGLKVRVNERGEMVLCV
jgi:cell growth-regulating nucleolar protein